MPAAPKTATTAPMPKVIIPFVQGLLSKLVTTRLNAPLHPLRVNTRDGNSYMEGYDIRAHLIRMFGYGGWSGDVLEETLLYEERWQQTRASEVLGQGTGPMRVSVGYRVRYRLTIWATLDGDLKAPRRVEVATYTEVATGAASNFPDSKRADAHDFAVKTAATQALKRCAINLGDQFGLSLYGRTGAEPLVKAVLVGVDYPDDDAQVLDPERQLDPEQNDTYEVPDDEKDWVAKAEEVRGDVDAFDVAYNDARKAHVSPGTLRSMKAAFEIPAASE